MKGFQCQNPKCGKNFNLALASCGTGYSWDLCICPHCKQQHAFGLIPEQVMVDTTIICNRISYRNNTLIGVQKQ